MTNRNRTRRGGIVLALVILAAAVGRAAAFGPPVPTETPPNTPPPPPKGPPVDEIGLDHALPQEPGDHKLKFRTHIDGTTAEMSYLLHLPPDYGRDRRQQFPMLVFFHGIGECGTDLAGVYALGPMAMIKARGGNPTFAASCPFIVLCPQCPPRGQKWDTDYIYKSVPVLVSEVVKKTRCDPDRVYATGLSMGGLGTWCVAEEAPNLFAAIGPLSAMMWQPEQAGEKLRRVAVWCSAGTDDEPRFLDGTRAMEKSLADVPATVDRRFVYLNHNGHDAFFVNYASPQFYEWLLEHHRPPADPAKKPATPRSPLADDAAAAAEALPTAPGHYRLWLDVKVGDQPYRLDYSLYLPKTYKPGTPCPTMLFLHEQETMGPLYHDLCCHGPDLELERHPVLQANFPLAVVSPRLPLKCDWRTPGVAAAALSVLDHLTAGGVTLDPARTSVSGINFGADGAIQMAADAPGRFSAVVPVVTAGAFTVTDEAAAAVAKLPGRAYVRANLTQAVNRAARMVPPNSKDWKLVRMPGSVNAIVAVPPYADRTLLTWLAQQQQRRPAAN